MPTIGVEKYFNKQYATHQSDGFKKLQNPRSFFLAVFSSCGARFFSSLWGTVFINRRFNSTKFKLPQSSGASIFTMHSEIVENRNDETQTQHNQIQNRQNCSSSWFFFDWLKQTDTDILMAIRHDWWKECWLRRTEDNNRCCRMIDCSS